MARGYGNDLSESNLSWWESYEYVNRRFAATIARDVQDNDMIWIQDYHLMLMPQMLREELGKSRKGLHNVKIGFFLHTPFPSFDIFKILPAKHEILRGIMGCDLIGFQVLQYVQNFSNCCSKILHLHTSPTHIQCLDRTIKIGAFPIGIDMERFSHGVIKPTVQARISALEKHFHSAGISTVLLSVDRLDYIKGIPQKLHALEHLFKQHPDLVRKVTFIQIAVPSRQDVAEYQQLRMTVNELVGRINSQYGSVEACPIHLLHRSVPFDELVALYSVADACVISSTRDRMNLVSYEYIATQLHQHAHPQTSLRRRGPGSLILSEFAGAAEVLHGALLVNPWNVEGTANTIYKAITLNPQRRQENLHKMEKHVRRCTSAWWGQEFVAALASTRFADAPVQLHDLSRKNLEDPVPDHGHEHEH